MDEHLLLTALKTDLGIRSELYDKRLTDRLCEAQNALADLGIVLEDTVDDRDLVIMYAAWLWRGRVDGEPMPRMLVMARNNRLFGRKMRAPAGITGEAES